MGCCEMNENKLSETLEKTDISQRDELLKTFVHLAEGKNRTIEEAIPAVNALISIINDGESGLQTFITELRDSLKSANSVTHSMKDMESHFIDSIKHARRQLEASAASAINNAVKEPFSEFNKHVSVLDKSASSFKSELSKELNALRNELSEERRLNAKRQKELEAAWDEIHELKGNITFKKLVRLTLPWFIMPLVFMLGLMSWVILPDPIAKPIWDIAVFLFGEP